MIILNYKAKLEKIKKIILQWNSRILTATERLTVIKTLLIQNVNHLLPALPNHSEEVIGCFENDLYKFLWKSKIHQVNKNIMIQDFA